MSQGHGYSGTPLPRKLGIREAEVVCVVGDPGHATELIAPLPEGATFGDQPASAQVVVLFVTERRALRAQLGRLARDIFPDRSLWIAWPKRASGVETDMTEDAIRGESLSLGLVDNKVCAIDGTWSGLRLVWRKELRGGRLGQTGGNSGIAG